MKKFFEDLFSAMDPYNNPSRRVEIPKPVFTVMPPHHTPLRRAKIPTPVFIAIVGLVGVSACWFLISFAIWGCGPAKIKKVNSIIHCRSSNVDQIVLLPLNARQLNLVSRTVTITDRATIGAICQSLNRAIKYSPNHPVSKWKVIVELCTQKERVSFVVMQTPKEENGTLISILSNTTSGWNYGFFRSDSLGPILEQLVKAEGAELTKRLPIPPSDPFWRDKVNKTNKTAPANKTVPANETALGPF